MLRPGKQMSGGLILMRRPEESIIIDEIIEIKVHKIRGQQVHLGIVAPKDISIMRKELGNKKDK